METLIDMQSENIFIAGEDNPEVMLDMLTMQSLRDRYSEKDLSEINLSAPYVNEQDFDNYVREFAIDDTISECFAASEDTSSALSLSKTYNSPTKQNRLKKKLIHKSPQEELILSDDDSRSSDSKRSKLIGHIFNRKQKGKENIKPIKEVESKESGDITGAIIDACEHITKTYKQPTKSTRSESLASDKSPKREMIKPQSSSLNSSDIYRRTSTRSRDSSSTRKLPPVPTEACRSDSSVSRRKHSSASSTGTSRKTPKKSEALIDELMIKNDSDLSAALHDLSYDALRKTRDRHGNTVLHRCVQDSKTLSTKTLSTKYPQMCSELNNDRLSALEYSVKLGQCECMLILLEKSRSDGVLESLTVPRLLNMAAEYDQAVCLESLLSLLPKGDNIPLELPPDSLGNTAAHEAAAKGHLRCFKILLENGYDVWSENSEGFCPMQLAIHNHHTECYGYMLLFESSRCLAREATHQFNAANRLKTSKMSNYDAFVQIESQLSRYQEQLNDALRSTLESQENILVTLDCICDHLSTFVKEDDSEMSSFLENIKGESERLQDLFDFSIIASANSVLTKLLVDFREVLKDADGKDIKDPKPDNAPYDNFRISFAELQKQLKGKGGANFEDDVKNHLLQFLESYKKKEVRISDTDSTTNTSSSTSNRTFTITKKSLKLPSILLEPSKVKKVATIERTESTFRKPSEEQSNRNQGPTRKESTIKRHDSKVIKNVESGLATSMSMSKNKTNNDHDVKLPTSHHLDTSFKDNLPSSPELPLLHSPSTSESVYTSTLTSDNTVGDQFSDWTSKSDTLCRESCGSGSEWWNEQRGYDEYEDDVDDEDSRVRLNVDNEDLSDDMLRQHRLNQHLKSVEKINAQRNDVIETVVTASGRQLGRSNPSKVPRPAPAPRPSINKDTTSKQKGETKRMSNIFSKIRNKNKVKLFSADDVSPSREITESEFMESYDRSRDGTNNDLKWDEMSLTDAEEYKTDEKPWYEMSEDEESLLQGWKSDDDDDNSRVLGNI